MKHIHWNYLSVHIFSKIKQENYEYVLLTIPSWIFIYSFVS